MYYVIINKGVMYMFGFGEDKTIKFDYDAVQKAYTAINQIHEQTVKVIEDLQNKSKTAEDKMKGQYCGSYSDKSKEVFDELKKQAKEVENLSDKIQKTSKDFLKKDMTIAESYKNGD